MDKKIQSPFPLGLNDTIYHEGNISKNFDAKLDLMGNKKNGNIKHKICTENA